MIPSTSSAPETLPPDTRSVDDMAGFQFNPVENDAAKWVVLRLHPEPYSGASTVAGKVMDNATGQLIDAPGTDEQSPLHGQSVIVLEGAWQWIGSVTGEAPAANRGSYSWMELPKVRLHQLTAPDLYSPFAKGGVILCRYDPSAEPAKQFDPVFLLPPNWVRAVRPGYEWFQKHRGLFNDGATEASESALAQVVLAGNRILSAMAFRRLAEANLVSPQLFNDASGRGDLYLKAILIYALLRQAPESQYERLAPSVEHWYETATAEAQRAAGLAIYARKILNQVVAPAGDREARLLRILVKRGAGNDPYLSEILRTLGG